MEAAELKKNSRVQKVVVTGCLAQRYSTELAGEHYHGCKETIGASLSDNTPTTRILSPACIAKLHGWRAPSGIDACSFASGTRPLALLFAHAMWEMVAKCNMCRESSGGGLHSGFPKLRQPACNTEECSATGNSQRRRRRSKGAGGCIHAHHINLACRSYIWALWCVMDT